MLARLLRPLANGIGGLTRSVMRALVPALALARRIVRYLMTPFRWAWRLLRLAGRWIRVRFGLLRLWYRQMAPVRTIGRAVRHRYRVSRSAVRRRRR